MKLCECGCGQPTVVNAHTDRWHGWVKGEPRRFIHGHNTKLMRLEPVEEDRGYATPCLIWPGWKNDRGYGRSFSSPAHKRAWEDVHGPVPPGYELDHLCRVRECMRVDHLEVVTHRENMRRAAMARAAGNVHEDGTGTRALRLALGITQRDLGEALGVSQALVCLWERGRHPIAEKYRIELDRMRRELAEAR